MDKAHAPKYLFARAESRPAARNFTTPMLVAEGGILVVKQPKNNF